MVMPLLSEKDAAYLREEFAKNLVHPVRLVMFTQTFACQYCKETEQIVREVADLSDKITAEIYNFVTDADKAKEYGVDKIPAIAVVGERDYGIRFYGIPSGYEFTSLIEDIFDVSRGTTSLSDATRKALEQLTEPVHIQVFVTPT
jgi:glutaredoxin-like protein